MTREEKCRRLVRLYPAEWRRQHEEELIGVLLEAADSGDESVSMVEMVDLVWGATLIRLQRVRGSVGMARLRAKAGTAGLVGTAVLGAIALSLAVGAFSTDVPGEFVLASLVVALVPGTGVVYTVSSVLSRGWRDGVYAVVGCTLGIVPHMVAALLGLSGVMQMGAVAFETLRWAGAVYLAFVGVSMWRERRAFSVDRGTAGMGPRGRVVRRGILLNLLNPKLTAFFFALLPQFLSSPPGLLDAGLMGLAGVFMLVTLVVFLGYAAVGAFLSERVRRVPAALRSVRRSLGVVFVGFAARLAVADR